MVPSRSRKTARRFGPGLDCELATPLFPALLLEPVSSRLFDQGYVDARHAAMVHRALTQKTRAARRSHAHQSAPRSYRGRALWIRGTEDGDYGNACSRSHVHRARIVADENVKRREIRGQIFDWRLAGRIHGALSHPGSDSRGDIALAGRAEKYHIGVKTSNQAVREFGKSLRWPAFRRTVRCSGCNSNPA